MSSRPGTIVFAVPGASAPHARVKVEIVEKPEDQARGLMDRTSLPEDEGMLFWIGVRHDHGFWAKRTLISLDLVFIDFDRVAGVLTMPPLDQRSYHLGRPSHHVLEVNGGWAARHGVKVGDRVQISLD